MKQPFKKNFLQFLTNKDLRFKIKKNFYFNLAVVWEKASLIFSDTADEFCNIGIILHRFMDWILADAKSYKEAYVELCIPKLMAPFIRLEMLNWRPFEV